MNTYMALAMAGVSCFFFLVGFLETNKAIRLEPYYETIHVKSVKFARRMTTVGFILLLVELVMIVSLQ